MVLFHFLETTRTSKRYYILKLTYYICALYYYEYFRSLQYLQSNRISDFSVPFFIFYLFLIFYSILSSLWLSRIAQTVLIDSFYGFLIQSTKAFNESESGWKWVSDATDMQEARLAVGSKRKATIYYSSLT